MSSSADWRHGPVLLSKTDLSNGFYQLPPLTPSGALKLTVPFPHLPHEPPLLAIPTSLPMMGCWTESPPAFSAFTENIADIVNEQLESEDPASMPPAHLLEPAASSPVPLAPSIPEQHPLLDTGPTRSKLSYAHSPYLVVIMMV